MSEKEQKTVEPISIKDFDFMPYGRYWNLRKERGTKTDKYEAYMTIDPPVERPLRFGMTICENKKDFLIDSMERHMSTEEVLFAGDKPIILSVAKSDPNQAPKAEDVVSLLMEPGDLVVMKRGIWHDACHAVEGDAMYYFLACNNGNPQETTWINIVPEPVKVTVASLKVEAVSGLAEQVDNVMGEKGKNIKAIHATKENFAKFGTVIRLKDTKCFEGDGWKCWLSEDVCMDQPAHFGITYVNTYPPYRVDSMERHTKTKELMVCGEKSPIVVALADSDPFGRAKSADVQGFYIEPGEALVINKGIWHDACRAFEAKTHYYFLSLETDEPAVFQPIEGDFITIER